MHCRLAQLVRIHLAQALEAADVDERIAHAFIAQPLQLHLALAVVQRIEALLGLHLAVGCHADRIKRCLRDEDMALLDQLREVPIEEGEQQRLDVRAVHVRVGHDDHLAVAKVVEHRIRRVRHMGIDAEGHRDVVHLGIAVELGRIHLEGVEDLALQRKDRLVLAIAALFRAAAGGVALDQEDFIARAVL